MICRGKFDLQKCALLSSTKKHQREAHDLGTAHAAHQAMRGLSPGTTSRQSNAYTGVYPGTFSVCFCVKPLQHLVQQNLGAESNNGTFRSVRCSRNFQSIARFISILRLANRSRQLAPVRLDPLKGARVLIWAMVFVRRGEPLIGCSRAFLMVGFRRWNMQPCSLFERSQLRMLESSISYEYF